jgi:hypothetical protein
MIFSKTMFSKTRRTETINRFTRILHFSQRSGFSFFNRVWKAYTPDSIAHQHQHPEVFELYQRFRRFNKGNNGGDIGRLLTWCLNIKHVLESNRVSGDLAEVGVYKGNSAAILAHYAQHTARTCYLFDTFEGFSQYDTRGSDEHMTPGTFADTSPETVKAVIGEPAIKATKIIPGHFPTSIPAELAEHKFAVVSLDCDLYQPTLAALHWFFTRMDTGALFMVHDYSSGLWPGTTQAVDEFCEQTYQQVVLLPDKSGSAFIRVQHNHSN